MAYLRLHLDVRYLKPRTGELEKRIVHRLPVGYLRLLAVYSRKLRDKRLARAALLRLDAKKIVRLRLEGVDPN